MILMTGIFIGILLTSIVFWTMGRNIRKDFMPRGEAGEKRMESPAGREKGFPDEPSKEKTTKASDVDTGVEVVETEIDLGQFSSNIMIKNSGEYNLIGEFEYSILVNATDEVILNLNGVNIKNDKIAAIANIGESDLSINIKEETENTLSDGGSSEYDGCIYSKGNLKITGNGKLSVYGNQEEGEGIATETKDITIEGGNIYIECNDDGINAGGDGGTITINGGDIFIKAKGDGIDSNKDLVINGGTIYTMGSSQGGDAGIDTDEGFVINGGNVIALGSDMIELPKESSKQNSLNFDLKSKITTGTLISLVNEKEEKIASFEAKEDFKTLIISNPQLEKGTYYLYTDDKNTGIKAEI